MATQKKRPHYKTVGGKKLVWRKGYTTSTGKRVAGGYVPLAGAALKASKKSRARNPVSKTKTGSKKVSAAKVKISQVRKTAPRGWKSTMGPYVICTLKGTKVAAFRSLEAAKKKLAALRAAGRKGLKLCKVVLSVRSSSKKTTSKKVSRKNPRRRVRRSPKRRAARKSSKRRVARKNPRRRVARKAPRRRVVRRRRNKATVTKKSLRSLMKKLGL